MFTACPQCDATFEIRAHQISTAHGHVRCGRCGEVFHCVDYLADEVDEDGGLPHCFHTDRPPTLVPADAVEDDPEDAIVPDLFLSREPDPIELELPEPELEPLDGDPQAMETLAVPEERSTRGLWIGGSAMLGVLLVGQLAAANVGEMAESPHWRPWLERACGLFGCELDLQRDLASIELVNRDIRPHPSVDDALIISATMQNRAAFNQPHPAIEIALSNLSGERIALRRFQPAEYLEEGVALERGIPPGTLLPLVFEVVDPGEDAVAFEFSFR